MKYLLIGIVAGCTACSSTKKLQQEQMLSHYRARDTSVQKLYHHSTLIWQDSSMLYVEIEPQGEVEIDWQKGFKGKAQKMSMYKVDRTDLAIQDSVHHYAKSAKETEKAKQYAHKRMEQQHPYRTRYILLAILLALTAFVYHKRGYLKKVIFGSF